MPELILEIEIDYDNDGITTRRVSVVDYEWNMKETAVILSGFCHLRQSGRSFNSAKIRRSLDLGNSSLIPDLPTYIRNLEGRPAPAPTDD
jgi:predicted DNA-binding transcriptional regulator YafY